MAKKSKKVMAKVKMQIPAGQATPAPPIGTALGPHGINIGDFTKQFNDQTKQLGGDIIPVEMTIFEDRSFEFILKSPPAARLILKAAGIKKGAANPLTDKVGKITSAQAREIAETKMADLNAVDLDAAEKIIRGTARSMGVEVTN